MSAEQITKYLSELREEFQIPPYFSDESLTNYLNEGEHELKALVSEIDFEEDLTAKSILKNYVFYAYNKKLDEFWTNYNGIIVKWQLHNVGKTNEEK